MTADLDATLQRVCPTVMVPRFSEFEPLSEPGHRFLAAHDGLHVEIARPWLYAVLPIGETTIPLPYGEIAPCVRFRFSGLAPLVEQFIEEALTHHPLEHAAWLTADDETGALSYADAEAISRGTGHVRYERPRLAPGVGLAIDLHSHGNDPAFFSPKDDRDSADDAKIEIVVGSLSDSVPTVCCRLSMVGLKIDYTAWLTAHLAAHGLYLGVTA